MSVFSGRVAVVTGSSRGIGRALAVALAREGAFVVVAARSEESRVGLQGSIHTVASEIGAAGGAALAMRVDVSREADVRRMVDVTVERFGRLDVLICNASALWWQPVLKTSTGRFAEILRVSLEGTYACLYHALPAMIANRWGHILTLSPPLDIQPLPGRGAYMAIKTAVTRLALTVASEHQQDGIAANAMWTHHYVESQATINWGMGDRREWQSPDLVCDAAMDVLSTEPPTLTGQQLIAESHLRARGSTEEDMARYVARSEGRVLSALGEIDQAIRGQSCTHPTGSPDG